MVVHGAAFESPGLLTRPLPDELGYGASGGPDTLVGVFEKTASCWPRHTALEAPDGVYSYEELADAINGLAARLALEGIGRSDRVAVRIRSGSAELYTAILAVMKVGAAYVPIDAEDPLERATDITIRSGACATIGDGLKIEAVPGTLPSRSVGLPTAEDDAWIIFTSGTTGPPKGVAVTHRSAASFVSAESALWDVQPDDRVLAGLSVGFDASCEEMWLAWGHGAALVPAPRGIVRAGVELGSWLIDNAITVVSTVPTLAALWDESCLQNVRLMILGGEACPEKLGWRLAAGREVWNTYGPTEATVVSTAAPIFPGAPITIGRPLDGWEVVVLDGDQPAAAGEVGELVISGVGLGRYLDPELDRARYAGVPALGWDRAYRTGDLVREAPHGLEFVGRRDDQVKIGGRRIELGEVESVLSDSYGVRAAAVAIRESAAGNKLLVGYVVSDGLCDCEQIRVHAARKLPSGMVPLVIEIPALPMTASGKVDRKALPWPVEREDPDALSVGIGADGSLLSDEEIWVAEQWVAQLGPVAVTPSSDFFALGGTSLAVAKLISSLRQRYPSVAVADLYNEPTLHSFTERLDQLAGGSHVHAAQSRPGRRAFAAAQLAGVLVLFGIAAVPWIISTFAYGNIVSLGTPHVSWVWLGCAYVLLASAPARIAMQALATRTLLSNVRAGRYSRYSYLTWRLWFVGRLSELARTQRLGGTPWAAGYARLLGMEVGEEVRLATVPPLSPLLRVGARATIEGSVDMQGWSIEGEELVIGAVNVGAGARIGARTLLGPGASIGDGAEIEPGSIVEGSVPGGEHWGGVPARYLGTAGADWPEDPPVVAGRTRRWRWLFALSLPLEAAIGLLAVVPATALLYLVGGFAPTAGSSIMGIVGEALCEVVITVPVFAVLVALTLRLVWKLVRPGWHTDFDAVGWALWFGEELRETATHFLFPLYASLYTRAWFRLMGLEVGARAEISTSTGLNPLVSFGDFSQSTDDVALCGARARDGWLHLAPIQVGRRSFVGPGSVLRGNTKLADGSLIGVLTVAPRSVPEGSSWFGVPALELPARPDQGDPAHTTHPPHRLVLARGVMDLVRLFLPNTLAVLIGVGELMTLATLATHLGLIAAITLGPLVMLAGGVCATAITIALKWIVIGRYRSGEHPLWSWFVWRDELINSAQEQLAAPMLLGTALGTPLMSLYLRLLGASVGRGVWLETIAVTEYDMIELGDGVAVNRGACLMTHLFHDRLLRIGGTSMRAGSTLGSNAAVLPDTILGEGTLVAGHSVVMRGEELPAGTRWQGAPLVATPLNTDADLLPSLALDIDPAIV